MHICLLSMDHGLHCTLGTEDAKRKGSQGPREQYHGTPREVWSPAGDTLEWQETLKGLPGKGLPAVQEVDLAVTSPPVVGHCVAHLRSCWVRAAVSTTFAPSSSDSSAWPLMLLQTHPGLEVTAPPISLTHHTDCIFIFQLWLLL